MIVLAGGAGAGVLAGRRRVGDVVRALDVPVAVGDVVQEPVDRRERDPPVAEPAERLVHAGAVPLGADLEQVVALEEGDVVEELQPVVVRVHGNEERHADAIAREPAPGVDEADVGVRERPRRWPGLIGPSYGRGRSSRAHWKRNSFDSEELNSEVRLPLTAWEWSFSRALALRPQKSTSNVPFCWLDRV